MTDRSLIESIKNSLNSETSDELLSIWTENNRQEWSAEAFQAIRELLEERGLAIPEHQQIRDESEAARPLSRELRATSVFRWILIVLHFLYMAIVLFVVVPSMGLFPPEALLVLIFVIQVNLFDRARKSLTTICCLLVVLAAFLFLELLDTMDTLAKAGFEGDRGFIFPWISLALILIILESATIIFAVQNFQETSGVRFQK